MKKLIITLATSLALLSCGSTETEKDAASTSTVSEKKNNHTLVFFDKTQSVNVDDAFVRTKYQSALKALIDQNIQTEGDIFEIYYIHENTAKAKVLSLSARTTKEDRKSVV